MVLNTGNVCSFADYFVICSGESKRQLEAIRDNVVGFLGEAGVVSRHCEGSVESGWILIDFGDVLVHVFAPFERDYYQLDQLWGKAALVVKIQ